nr:uncharacterized protein LOC123766275 [Procambarus clarkii]
MGGVTGPGPHNIGGVTGPGLYSMCGVTGPGPYSMGGVTGPGPHNIGGVTGPGLYSMGGVTGAGPYSMGEVTGPGPYSMGGVTRPGLYAMELKNKQKDHVACPVKNSEEPGGHIPSSAGSMIVSGESSRSQLGMLVALVVFLLEVLPLFIPSGKLSPGAIVGESSPRDQSPSSPHPRLQ